MGQSPYYGMSVQEVIQYITCGNVMEKSEEIPTKIYQVMLKCWEQTPEQRPTFIELVGSLSELIEQANEVVCNLVQDNTKRIQRLLVLMIAMILGQN